jgi:phosphatidylserine/phosphatidylglycerophosphate/cardiolipin synthase-like enzyme
MTALAGCTIFATACTSTPTVFRPDPTLKPVAVNRPLSCPEAADDHCAFASPLQDLADAALSASPPLTYVGILDRGDEALTLRVHLIRAARRSIEIQTFTWVNDPVGNLLFSELLAAARRGVRVRVNADQFHSGGDPKNIARLAVTHQNLRVKLYNPINGKADNSIMTLVGGFACCFQQANHRMHNKVMVIDGRIGIIGGRNIEDSYYDWDAAFNFIDRDALVIGPVAADMRSSFETYWSDPVSVSIDLLPDVRQVIFDEETQRPLEPRAPDDTSMFDALIARAIDPEYVRATFADALYQVEKAAFVADPPRKPFRTEAERSTDISSRFQATVGAVEKRLVVQTPYLVLSDPAIETLRDLRERNPDIEYIVSTNSLASIDAYYAYGISFKHKKRYVSDLGMRIYEMKPRPGDVEQWVANLGSEERRVSDAKDGGLPASALLPLKGSGPRFGLHAKALVIDGEVAVIGSYNFDPRSRDTNTEAVLMVWDAAFAGALERSIRRIAEPQNSWTIARRQTVPVLGWVSGLLASISRHLPFFDLWPFRYSTSFALKAGSAPVASSDPRFYDNYENVGQFPEVAVSGRRIGVLLLSAFGQPLAPLM